jgi:hypothetical protein
MEENLEKKLALLDFLDVDYFKANDCYYYIYDLEEGFSEEVLEYKENDNPDCSECDNYLVLTDDEADDRLDEYLENYIEECIIPEIPKPYQSYFDNESWKSDATQDGRGCLAHYDGQENEQNGYYIYRIN